MRRNDAARFIAHAALKAGRDPLREIGLGEAPLTVSTATLLFELLMVKEDEQLTETEATEAAEEVLARMDREDAWNEATDPDEGGYQGPRGRTRPGLVPTLYPLRNPDAAREPPPQPWTWPKALSLEGAYTLTFSPPRPAEQAKGHEPEASEHRGQRKDCGGRRRKRRAAKN